MSKFKIVAKRFLKGFIGSGIASIVVIASSVPGATFKELEAWVSLMAITFIIGGISGAILATDKFINYKK